MTELPSRRLLLVHAHPDDESINNGATMARYAAEGVHVTLVTCTLGERGEVIPPELRHLTGAALGEHRRGNSRRPWPSSVWTTSACSAARAATGTPG